MARLYEPPPPLPAENGVHVWRAAIVVPIITCLFVAARFYTRLRILNKRLRIDDCMSIHPLKPEQLFRSPLS